MIFQLVLVEFKDILAEGRLAVVANLSGVRSYKMFYPSPLRRYNPSSFFFPMRTVFFVFNGFPFLANKPTSYSLKVTSLSESATSLNIPGVDFYTCQPCFWSVVNGLVLYSKKNIEQFINKWIV